MARLTVALAEDATSPATLLRMPTKAEGDSLKALLVNSVRLFLMEPITYGVSVDFQMEFFLTRIVPTRWEAERLIPSLPGGAGPALPVGFSLFEDRTIWAAFERGSSNAAAIPIYDKSREWSLLPRLMVCESIQFSFGDTGVTAWNAVLRMDYEFVDVTPEIWEALLL